MNMTVVYKWVIILHFWTYSKVGAWLGLIIVFRMIGKTIDCNFVFRSLKTIVLFSEKKDGSQ